MQRSRTGTRILAALLLSLLAALTLPAGLSAQAPGSASDKAGVRHPGRTDAGEWNGTWYYKTHTQKWALWIREETGIPELKFQMQDYSSGENFITDWLAVSHYAADAKKGLFKLTFSHLDQDLIEGDWFWQLGTHEIDDLIRTETATFEIYRQIRGRQAVLRFHGYHRLYEGRAQVKLAAEQSWVFHKASRRLVRWQELPF